jgi:hypothetical protein
MFAAWKAIPGASVKRTYLDLDKSRRYVLRNNTEIYQISEYLPIRIMKLKMV